MTPSLEACIQKCIKQSEDIVLQLNVIRADVETFHRDCNIAKSVGTGVGTAGAAALIASILFAPVTGGASLAVGALGFGASVAGGVTNLTTDVIDSYKTSSVINQLKNFVDQKRVANEELLKYIDIFKQISLELAKRTNISVDIALQAVLKGAANKTLDVQRGIDRNVTFLASIGAYGALTKAGNMAMKELPLLTKVGLKSTDISLINSIFGISGKVSSVTKFVGKATAILSAIFVVVDLVQLVNSWTTQHATIESVDNLKRNLQEEVKLLKDFQRILFMLKDPIFYTTIPYKDYNYALIGTEESVSFVVALIENDLRSCRHILHAFGIDLPNLYTIDKIMKNIIDYDTEKGKLINIFKTSGKKAKRLVKTFFDELLKNLEKENVKPRKKDNRSRRGEHIINNGVLKFNKDVVSEFVYSAFNKTYDETLARLPPHAQVRKDCQHPISQENHYNIQSVLVAHIDEEYSYIDTNDVIYGITIEFLRQNCVAHMTELHHNFDSYPPHGGTHHTSRIRATIDSINMYPIFVDFAALQYWINRQGGNRQVYENAKTEVLSMFNKLYDSLRPWLREIRPLYVR